MTRTNPQLLLRGFVLLAAFIVACNDNGTDTDTSTAGPSSNGSTGPHTSSTGHNTSSTGDIGSSSSTGPTSGVPGTSTSTSTGASTGDATDGSTDSTGASGPCSRVHEGDLIVESDTDLAPLADIGRVTGTVYIAMGDRDQADLSFLSCLHTIDDGLSLQNNVMLESMEGLENLKSVFRIFIFNNSALWSIDHIGPITNLFSLVVDSNSALEEIHLESVETIGLLEIGHCQGMMGSALQNKLIDLSGFSGLTNVDNLTIEGNAGLMTADVLDALAANGAPKPLSFATIRYNLLLPEADVHAKLDVLGLSMQQREICGNAEGDPECYCIVG